MLTDLVIEQHEALHGAGQVKAIDRCHIELLHAILDSHSAQMLQLERKAFLTLGLDALHRVLIVLALEINGYLVEVRVLVSVAPGVCHNRRHQELLLVVELFEFYEISVLEESI